MPSYARYERSSEWAPGRFAAGCADVRYRTFLRCTRPAGDGFNRANIDVAGRVLGGGAVRGADRADRGRRRDRGDPRGDADERALAADGDGDRAVPQGPRAAA